MNKISIKDLARVAPIIESNNVSSDAEFDYFRIVAINNTKYEESIANTLYFFSYNTDEEIKAGWFNEHFDLRKHTENIIAKYPNATFVFEEGMPLPKDKSIKYIVVKNIPETIDNIYEYIKGQSTALIIAVTGSVGKTTTVGLIESVLKQKYNVLRIYSKRITPIILKSNIINFLTSDIDYIVLENSLYYHDHVEILSNILPPDIACMINIESAHLGLDGMNTLDDICVNKAKILKNAFIGIINTEDEYLKNIKLDDKHIKYNEDYLFTTNLHHIEDLSPSSSYFAGEDLIIDNKFKIKPFIKSDLAKTQYSIATRIGELTGLSDEEIINGLNDYTPVENRLNTKMVCGKEVIFDGDITSYERMQEISNIKYDKRYLVLRKVGSKENTERIVDIKNHFKKFTKVYLFSDMEYLDELKDAENVEIVDNHSFMANLDGKIVYHYSGYYRVWPYFSEENLNIYDEEVYPIKKAISQDNEKIRKLVYK